MSHSERVVVVDEVSDTAEVLKAVLSPRGMMVNRIRQLDQTATSRAEDRPAVVVLDAESLPGSGEPAWEGWRDVPLVIIGTMRLADERAAGGAPRRYLQKPFQFVELIQAIETLIARMPES